MAGIRITTLREFVERHGDSPLADLQAAYPAPFLVHEQGAGDDGDHGSTLSGRPTAERPKPGRAVRTSATVDGAVVLLDMDGSVPRISLGRGNDTDVPLRFDQVSRLHAYVFRDPVDDSFAIVDAGSTNGTRVNGRALGFDERCALADGDEIGLGNILKVTFFTAEGLHRYLPVLKRRIDEDQAIQPDA